MSIGRYYLLPILMHNRLYCHNCCCTRTRSVEIYSSNNDIKEPIIKEDKIDLNTTVSDDFKNKNKQNIEKMLKFIKNDISTIDIDEIIVLLYNINDSNYGDILKKIYTKLNIDSYLNIVKNRDLVYVFKYKERFINIIPGVHYFYYEKVKSTNNTYSNSNDIGRIEFYSNIKTDIFKILLDEYLKKDKGLPLETMLKISDNLKTKSNYNFTISLNNDSFDDEFYILIDKENNKIKKVSNLNSLEDNSDSNYKIIKIHSNKIEFINKIKN